MSSNQERSDLLRTLTHQATQNGLAGPNNLPCLFNISHFSSLCGAKNFSLIRWTQRMAKRMHEQSEEKRTVSKSRPTAMNLTSSVATSSSSVNSPIASRRPRILKASSRQVRCSGRPDASTNQNSNLGAAQRCSTIHQHRETCGNEQGSEVSESAGKFCHQHRGTCGN